MSSIATRVGSVALRRDRGVVWAVLDRPQARNAIDDSLLHGLEGMLALVESQPVQVLVIRGAGGCFCSGADLHTLREMIDQPERLRTFMHRFGTVLKALERGSFCTVALVEGHAVAGGLELLLACDVAIATFDAALGDRHAEYGLVPAAGGSVRLTRTLPRAVANYLLLTGELMTGEEAAALGLVTLAAPKAQFEPLVERVVERLRTRSGASIATIKRMVSGSPEGSWNASLERELDFFMEHVARSCDVRHGLTAFSDKQRPRFEPIVRAGGPGTG